MASTANEKYIGLALAFTSSILIGSSFVITKFGLNDASKGTQGGAGDLHSYLKNWKWWTGMSMMVLGEIANFAAYSFAPAILVTPLGAMSVLIGAVMASIFLKERMGRDGIIGCALCIIGSIVIVMHAPSERSIQSIDEFMVYVVKPGFLVYMILIFLISVFLIFKVSPKHGKNNIMVYLSICSLVGSISVMAIKAFAVALKLTFEGNNQLTNPYTYFFGIIVITAACTQVNYFNKSLATFSTNVVNPIYYVLFTSATIVASLILFQGFDDAKTVDIVSVFCGFGTIFAGVFMLNSKNSQKDREIQLMESRRSGLLFTSLDEENRTFKLYSSQDLEEQ